MIKKLLLISILTLSGMCKSLTAQELLKDIWPGGNSSEINFMTKIDTTLYFTAKDGTSPYPTLWKTDGTTAGTVMAKDPDGKNYGEDVKNLFYHNNDLFYSANKDLGFPPTLWQSYKLGSRWPVDKYKNPKNFIEINYINESNGQPVSYMHFTADIANNGHELMVWNETANGVFKEAWEGAGSSNPREFTHVGDGFLYFLADYPVTGGSKTGLYISFHSFGLYARVSDKISVTGEMIAYKGALFFAGTDGITGVKLYKTKGLEENTVVVKPTGVGSKGSVPNSFFVYNNFLFFKVTDQSGTTQWRTDGTDAGTVQMTKQVSKGIAYNNFMYFGGPAEFNGTELWKTDGTDTGTVKVANVNNYINGSNPDNFVIFKDLLLFTASDSTNQRRLYKTDGTEAGTKLANPYSKIKAGSNYIVVNNILYFTSSLVANGTELCKWDGSITSLAKPDAPLSPNIIALEKNVMLVFWEKTDLAEGYIIQKSLDGVNFTTIDTTASFEIKDSSTTTGGITCYYRIMAYNSIGTSNFSKVVSDITVDLMVPDNPRYLKVHLINNHRIDLEWQYKSTTHEGFIIERQTYNSDWVIVDTVTIASYSDSLLAEKTTYFYRVCSYNAAGRSEYSFTENATTVLCTGINTPWNISVEVKYDLLFLRWYSELVDTTVIERGIDKVNFTVIDTVVRNSYFDSSAVNKITYYYRVYSLQDGDRSCYSSHAGGSLNLNTGIKKTTGEDPVLIYPNPVNEQLFIELPDPEKTAIELFNIEGQLMHSNTVQSLRATINTGNLPGGIYFLKITNASGLTVKKIIKY